MSRLRPILQKLCPLSPWVGEWWPQIIAPRYTMGPLQAGSIRIALAAVDSFVWANKFNASKNRVMGGGLALGVAAFL